MAIRPVWRGYLRLSLVSLPVRAYSAVVSEAGSLPLNQLHGRDGCHRRIRYLKVCPEHGEVSNDEIVMGYQYAPDRYVTLTEDELKSLHPSAAKTITIDTFVAPEKIDPVHFRGRSYYLLPDGHVADKPYALLERTMREDGRHALAQAVLFGREQLLLVRPKGGLLLMSTLNHEQEVRQPSLFDDEAPARDVSQEELKLTKMLIDASTTDDFDFARYDDRAAEKLKQLVASKMAGETVVSPPAEDDSQVINIMDALRASMAQLGEGGQARPSARKMAPSSRASRKRRRKVS